MAFKWKKDKEEKGIQTKSARIISEKGEDVGELTIITTKTSVDVNIDLGKFPKLKHHKNQSLPFG